MRTLLVAAVTAVATVLPAAAASADQLALKDPRGDVWGQQGNAAAVRAPNVKVGDLTRAVVHNTRSTVTVVLRFVDIARAGRYAQYDVVVQSKATMVRRELLLEAGPGRWKGVMRVFHHNGTAASCPTSHRIDYAANVVTVRMRGRCLGEAISVRAQINTYRGLSHARFYSDNPAGTTAQMTGWTGWVHR